LLIAERTLVWERTHERPPSGHAFASGALCSSLGNGAVARVEELEPNTMPWPLTLHIVVATLLVASILAVSHVLGSRRRDRRDADPYESGIAVTGSARRPLPVQFYLVGIAFVIFDLEVVFLVAWAVAATDVGWPGYAAAAVFVVVLLVGLLYEWRTGLLDLWRRPHDPRSTQQDRAPTPEGMDSS
jgi:NADH-quinone oxidoreductase subunit A